MNILFICKHNKFRSRIAESYFNKINTNKNIKVKSAGILPGSDKIYTPEVETAKEFSLKLYQGKTKAVSTDLLRWANLIILVANDIPVSLLNENSRYNYNVRVWKIADEHKGNKTNIRKIIKKIITYVDKLYNELEKIKT